MSIQGICTICEATPAEYQCRRCGALVCTAHYDRDAGLCTECAAAIRPPDGEGVRR
ncbi:hypothetical protein GJR96_16675 [Haloferax sp. MBLA0076]|uniref:HIT-type domain-containing protein n=1 Tax=Haloferax litoreum TaxID=2666140 RepID=A0A6A8GNR6_9EURY|nr:hypothetical protein Hfx1148_16620 [Haloferax sp. CBA1148]MRX23580.1 hypothetical protein [Haloferax litoreum]